jgi:hypothetical protein
VHLSWSEAVTIVRELIARPIGDLREERDALSQRAILHALDAGDRARLDTLSRTVHDYEGMIGALAAIAEEHLRKAVALLDGGTIPDTWEGFWVRANYSRMIGDWARFDEMMTKLGAVAPNSEALSFLRGVEAIQRKNDPRAAQALLEDALKAFPDFARARVSILLLRTQITDVYAEYQLLKQASPTHQIVQLAGPAIERAYERWTEAGTSNRRARLAY